MIIHQDSKAAPLRLIECPNCGARHETHHTAIRQDPQRLPGFIDVGWRCMRCLHEWGFEVFTDPTPPPPPPRAPAKGGGPC